VRQLEDNLFAQVGACAKTLEVKNKKIINNK
jgi:hypothetical protein